MKVLSCSFCGLFLLVVFVSAKPSDITSEVSAQKLTYRLPNDTIPLRYDLWLKTDVDKENYEFKGEVKITVKTVQPTNRIVLKSKELEIEKIDLLAVDGSSSGSKLPFKLNEEYDSLIISLPKTTIENEELVLDIHFSGYQFFFGGGFVIHEIEEEGKDKKVFASFRLDPIHARQVFPCFDEPQILAPIKIRVQHVKSFNAISNMPIINRTEVSDTDYVTSEFEESFPMPLYLVKLTVFDFKYVSNNNTRIEQRVYGLQKSLDNGEADLAFGVFEPFIRKLEDYFGIEYAVKKIDHISFDYRDNEKDTRYFAKEKEISDVAEKLTKDYFGYFVTQYWSNVWLTQGLSYFYSNYLLNQINPNEYYTEQLVPPFKYCDSQTLNSYADTLTAIEAKSNSIRVQRASAIIQMFNAALTPKTFAKGIKYYLTTMKHKTSTPDDLHRGLQKAFDEDYPRNGIDIGEAMRTWEDRKCYTFIHVEKNGNKFNLTQEGDRGDIIYTIPVFYTTASHSNFDEPKFVWMKTKTIEIESSKDNDWIILNTDFTGYYKVKYSKNITENIIDALNDDHTSFPTRLRAHLFKDFSKLIAEDFLPVTTAFKLFEYLKTETDHSLFKNFNEIFKTFKNHLLGTEAYPNFEQFIRSLVKPHLDKLGYKSIDGELKQTSDFRETLKQISCEYNQPECLQFEYDKLKDSLKKNETYISCAAFKTTDEEAFLRILKLAEPENDVRIVSDYFEGLGCSRDKNLIKKLLTTMMNHSDEFMTKIAFEHTLGHEPEAFDVSLDFISENLDEFKSKVGDMLEYFIEAAIIVNDKKSTEKFETVLNKIKSESNAEYVDKILKK